jgi:hypothetical protein
MAGKGSQLRKGANLQKYWDNYPFVEKNTVSYWKSKLGMENHSDSAFLHLRSGQKISEIDYMNILENYYIDSSLSEKDLEKFQDDMNSMNFSEFTKITNKKH